VLNEVRKIACAIKESSMGVTILHLSDFHAGPGALRDVDEKEHITGVAKASVLEDLTAHLQRLKQITSAAPDFVAITGDVADRNSPEGFREVTRWLSDRIEEKVLPPASHILLTPGNHDVKFGVKEYPGWHRERYSGFGSIALDFPHAYLPDYDPPLSSSQPNLYPEDLGLCGGLQVEERGGFKCLVATHPFLLDLDRDVLLFAFNSSLACHVYQGKNAKIVEPLETLSGTTNRSKKIVSWRPLPSRLMTDL
jgi:hypothetical protein